MAFSTKMYIYKYVYICIHDINNKQIGLSRFDQKDPPIPAQICPKYHQTKSGENGMLKLKSFSRVSFVLGTGLRAVALSGSGFPLPTPLKPLLGPYQN